MIRRLRICMPLGPIVLVVAALAVVGCSAVPRDHAIRYYELKQYDQADQRFSAMVKNDPTDWEALYYLGLVRLEQNRPLDAELLLDQAYHLRTSRLETARILDALAESIYRQQRTASLYAMLEEATANYNTSHDYIRQGKYLALSGDADAARVAFGKAAKFARADDATPYLAIADFYESIGNIPETVTALRHAYYLTPNDTVIWRRLRQHGYVPGPSVALPPDREQ